MHRVSTANTPNPTRPTDMLPRQWAEQVREAQHSHTHLRIRGGGSKPVQPPGPVPGWGVIDTQAHAGVVAYEPSELVVTVRTGTPLSELENTLAAQGQHLPFDPPRLGPGGTVGGMVAAGWSGPSRASVGAVRDYLLGAQLINGRGEQLVFGGQVMKNVAGYDVSRVLAGSLGSLGVITEVSLKVLPVPVAETTLRMPMEQASALAHLARWRALPLPLNASCWVRDATAQPPQAVLYLRLRGARAAVEAAARQLLADTPGERLDDPATGADWDACRDHQLPFFSPPAPDLALWRLSVPPNTPPLEGLGDTLVEWHGGQRWLWAPLSAAIRLRATAQRAKGHATLFRWPATGPDAGTAIHSPPTPAVLAIQRRLKTAFDPAGVFNPGTWGPGH